VVSNLSSYSVDSGLNSQDLGLLNLGFKGSIFSRHLMCDEDKQTSEVKFVICEEFYRIFIDFFRKSTQNVEYILPI
jgi:hypothetical protein